MTEAPKKSVDKTVIKAQIADLSKLLGMIPNDDTVTVNEPMTQNSMALSEWFIKTRDSFLKLSMLIDKALELNLK